MIDWLFPNDPETPWLFNTPSTHLSSLDLYMLLVAVLANEKNTIPSVQAGHYADHLSKRWSPASGITVNAVSQLISTW